MLFSGNLIVFMEEIDICIIGAGVTGLALAYRLSIDFPEAVIALAEQHAAPGQETSSRNSEVIHAGIYYRPGSAKARYCLEGRQLLYAFCQQHQIAVKRTGKLIVAQAGEESQLNALLKNAVRCGVDTLQELSGSELRRREPNVCASAALWSPDTGIIDSHSYLQTLAALAQRQGVLMVSDTRFMRADVDNSGQPFRLAFHRASGSTNDTPDFLKSRILINSAGLAAARVSQQILMEDGLTTPAPTMLYSKGNYFSLSGAAPFASLIYPVPDPSGRGLGIHATLDMQGRCRFGPDVEALDQTCFDPFAPDYRVDESRLPDFVEQIRRYYPGLSAKRLMPDYSGIRTRTLSATGEADFANP